MPICIHAATANFIILDLFVYLANCDTMSLLHRTQHSGEKSTNSQWESIHASLSKAIRRAAKVALGKDPAKVQKYTNSGNIYTHPRACIA